jgi:hypothetical protein
MAERFEPGHPWLHSATGNNPRAWLATVEALATSARRVYDHTEMQFHDGSELMSVENSVAAMLFGYAIECALKGLWVGAGNKLVVEGKYQRPGKVSDHQLRQLAELVTPFCQIRLTAPELNVLDRLSHFVRFAGRYPVPRRAEEMGPVPSYTGRRQVPSWFSSDDFDVTKRLLKLLTTALMRVTGRIPVPRGS